MAKEILILGAGMVARPIVSYLLEQPNYRVTVASRTVAKAEQLIGRHGRGVARALNVEDDRALEADVRAADIVISLVPYTYHVKIAKLCLAHKKHLVTTSYVSPAMRELDAPARAAGLLFLNEIGLDPGIDHMSAMRIIHAAQRKGGIVESFRSFCGGLPAPEANTNPWGYKFSWSPRAVVMAGRNNARYLEDGFEVRVPGEALFSDCRLITVPGAGDFEYYPNRDSLPYVETYGLQGCRTMFRGTLRNPSWCATWLTLARLGFLADTPRAVAGLTYREFTKGLLGLRGDDVEAQFAARAGVPADAPVVAKLAWLGMFGPDKVPGERVAPMDVLAGRLLLKCPYGERERDMIIIFHDLVVAYPGKKERVTSTLLDFGVPGGDSAMARTVSLPAAIATRLMAEGRLPLAGVHIPVVPAVYEPVLNELETVGIKCVERTAPL
jgi:saccharopine dehydrogenase-like NADP-dependent oxidoreductase